MNWLSLTEILGILEFFTFRPSSKCELWSKPIVEIDDQNITIAMTPILFGNTTKNIELWLKDGGIDISSKGHLFENYCRDSLKKTIESSPILKNAGVHPSKLIIYNDQGNEEVDLILWILNHILLVEIKCIYFPTSALEHHNYFEILRNAACQIKRKTTLAKHEIEQLLKKLGINKNTEPIKLIPCILTNHVLGSGYNICGIPVVDLTLLKTYLGEGFLKNLVKIDGQGKIDDPIITTKLYETEEEAAIEIEEYLNHPPQLQMYLNSIQQVINPLPKIDSKDKGMASLLFEVNLPFVETV